MPSQQHVLGGAEAVAGFLRPLVKMLGELDARRWPFPVWRAWPSTASSTATSEAARVFITWKPTTGRPFRRAKPRTSPAPSPTSSHVGQLHVAAAPVGMVISRSWPACWPRPGRARSARGRRPRRARRGRRGLAARRALFDLRGRQAAGGQLVGVDDDVDLARSPRRRGGSGPRPSRPAGRATIVSSMRPGELVVRHRRRFHRVGGDRQAVDLDLLDQSARRSRAAGSAGSGRSWSGPRRSSSGGPRRSPARSSWSRRPGSRSTGCCVTLGMRGDGVLHLAGDLGLHLAGRAAPLWVTVIETGREGLRSGSSSPPGLCRRSSPASSEADEQHGDRHRVARSPRPISKARRLGLVGAGGSSDAECFFAGDAARGRCTSGLQRVATRSPSSRKAAAFWTTRVPAGGPRTKLHQAAAARAGLDDHPLHAVVGARRSSRWRRRRRSGWRSRARSAPGRPRRRTRRGRSRRRGCRCAPAAARAFLVPSFV